MHIQIASDLHLEFLQRRFPGYRVIEPATGADVLVIAGDIHCNANAIAVFADWPVPVIYVHGNHELYNDDYAEGIAKLCAAAAGTNVHYLEQDARILSGVRFLGCCMWTDYRLDPAMQQAAMAEAEDKILDHRLIRMADTEHGLFRPEHALHVHQQSRTWLEAKLQEPFDGPTVVVTHHAPHPGSIHPRYAGTLVNAAFISDLTPLLGKAALWVHGHVHDSFDYAVAGTRVIANPRGYPLNRLAAKAVEEIEWENVGFDAELVLRV